MAEIPQGKKPHVLAVPFPAQGHVRPLMKLSQEIAKRGIKVTFVNIESVHKKLLVNASKKLKEIENGKEEEEDDNIILASIPDGRRPQDDPNDSLILLDSLRQSMPGFLKDLIERINSSSSDEKIRFVIIDITIAWIYETTEMMGAETIFFCPASAATLAFVTRIPALVNDGILDSNGTSSTGEAITLSDNIPPWKSNEFSWICPTNLIVQKLFFESTSRIFHAINRAKAKWLVGNTFYELEPAACDLDPKLSPVGPLLEPSSSKSFSSFHPEDDSCLSWLEDKPIGSVVYVSFGSLAVISQHQLNELALGLESSGRAFLWVVRFDLTADGSQAVYPDGFLERVTSLGLGKIVEWAPQEKVLSHPSVGCFMSHCGWNSTLEGLINGILFLCWPYFVDQFHNQNYICDKWKIGLKLDFDENGIRTRDEIKEKINVLLSDDEMKGNALKLKEIAVKSVTQGGSSHKNFERFTDYLKN